MSRYRKNLDLDVKGFHSLGRLAQRRLDKVSANKGNTYGAGVLRRLAKERKVPVDLVYKARDFASKFTKEEAKQLTDSGLQRSHVMAVLKLPKEERDGLLLDAAIQQWSVKRLSAEANARRKVRGYGGRKAQDKSVSEIREELRLQFTRLVAYVAMLDEHEFYGLDAKQVKKLRSISKKATWLLNRMFA